MDAWGEQRFVRSGDVDIAYAVEGSGPIDLLIVPGFVSHLEVLAEAPGWLPFLERLSRFTRVIMFGRRGMGLSERTGGISTVENTTTDMLAVLDAEVLVSNAVRDLVAGSRIEFDERGQTEFKGVPGRRQLLAVRA